MRYWEFTIELPTGAATPITACGVSFDAESGAVALWDPEDKSKDVSLPAAVP